MNRSEILSSTEVSVGPELPIAVFSHCMITTKYGVYSIGGVDKDDQARNETWFWAKGSYEWKREPDLNVPIREIACGSFTFKNNTVLVIANGKESGSSSTQFLNLAEENRVWREGPQLPYVSWTTVGYMIVYNEEFLYSVNIYNDLFYTLMCPDLLSNCYWEPVYDVKLKYPRMWAVALMLPDDMIDMVNCTATNPLSKTNTMIY